MWLILGLGNPGARYARSRHNAGWRVADCLGGRWGCPLARQEARSRVGRTRVGEQEIVLARPGTFMNLSGEAARALGDRYGVDPARCLVVCDDVDLPLGRLRLRAGGSAGGHRGLLSVTEALGTEEFPRLRVGVGRPPEGMDTADWVLSDFGQEEETIVARVVPAAADAVEAVLRTSLERAMSEFNGMRFDGEGPGMPGPGGG